MIKERDLKAIVFDKDYNAFGRIVNIENSKETGETDIVWIDLFPDARHRLHWESTEAVPVKFKDFKSSGEFNKLRWDLKELKKYLMDLKNDA